MIGEWRIDSSTIAALILMIYYPGTLWLLARFAIPVGAAIGMLLVRWGKDNVAYLLLVPALLLVINMYLSWLQRPTSVHLDKASTFNRALALWHVADVLSLVFLAAFEGAIAILAEIRATAAVLPVVVLTFFPYTLLSLFARSQLDRANAMLALGEQHLLSSETRKE